MRRTLRPTPHALFAVLTLCAPSALAATLEVGPGKTYAKPCDAIAKAAVGDLIEVDAAGNYNGDTCAWSTDNLTVRGVNGRAKIDLAGGSVTQGKGIFVIYAPSATVENFELSGATDGDSNGAGIRHQGLNLTVRNCYFHDNQDGILGGPLDNGQGADGKGEVLIERSEFYKNGAGDGYSHNMYIGHYAKFTLQGSWSHAANVGHLVKTRAAENYILYNRITDEDGSASYEIDVPNGGKTFIIGNEIQQGTATQNPNIIAYEEEGMYASNPSLDLFIVNNSLVNALDKGTFVHVGGDVSKPALLQNNILVGPGTVCDQASATLTDNFQGDPSFVDAAGLDFHLKPGSPCIDKGQAPGMGDGYALTPDHQYKHPADFETRGVVGVIDQGAYEVGGGSGGSTTGSSAATTTSGGGTTSGNGGNGGNGGAEGTGGGAGTGGGGTGMKSGCGCRVGGDGSSAGAAALIALAGAILARRRRRAAA